MGGGDYVRCRYTEHRISRLRGGDIRRLRGNRRVWGIQRFCVLILRVTACKELVNRTWLRIRRGHDRIPPKPHPLDGRVLAPKVDGLAGLRPGERVDIASIWLKVRVYDIKGDQINCIPDLKCYLWSTKPML